MIPARTLPLPGMMIRTLTTIAAAGLALLAFAQAPVSAKEKARGYVNALAGPEMHGRGYVLEGDRIAADWIAAQFDRLGLKTLNGERFEPFVQFLHRGADIGVGRGAAADGDKGVRLF